MMPLIQKWEVCPTSAPYTCTCTYTCMCKLHPLPAPGSSLRRLQHHHQGLPHGHQAAGRPSTGLCRNTRPHSCTFHHLHLTPRALLVLHLHCSLHPPGGGGGGEGAGVPGQAHLPARPHGLLRAARRQVATPSTRLPPAQPPPPVGRSSNVPDSYRNYRVSHDTGHQENWLSPRPFLNMNWTPENFHCPVS